MGLYFAGYHFYCMWIYRGRRFFISFSQLGKKSDTCYMEDLEAVVNKYIALIDKKKKV